VDFAHLSSFMHGASGVHIMLRAKGDMSAWRGHNRWIPGRVTGHVEHWAGHLIISTV